MFQTFVEELKKYDESVHRLYSPASDSSINAAESKLQIELPAEYRAFLSRWNGGLLFAKEFYDILIWSIDDELTSPPREYDCEVVRMNDTLNREHNHPRSLLAIASYSDGNLLCLDMSRQGRPVLWLRNEERIEQEWDRLTDWLTHEMEEGATLYDYHGDERD